MLDYELLEMATCFRIDDEIVVQKRGDEGWSILGRNGSVIDANGVRECELQPEARDTAFLERFRFPRDEAIRIAFGLSDPARLY